jgi:hypothetical protein
MLQKEFKRGPNGVYDMIGGGDMRGSYKYRVAVDGDGRCSSSRREVVHGNDRFSSTKMIHMMFRDSSEFVSDLRRFSS